MAAKKIKEVTGVFNPWWDQERIDTFMSNISTNSVYKCNIINYKHETHLPFYSLVEGDISRLYSLFSVLATGNQGKEFPKWISQAISDKKTVEFFRQLWNTNKKMFLDAVDIRTSSGSSTINIATIAEALKRQYQHIVDRPIDTNLYLANYSGYTGALNVVKMATVGTNFGIAKVNTKNGEGAFKKPQYLFGRYFIAHLLDFAANGMPLISRNATTYETTHTPIPLMSLMFKVEHIRLVRSYLMLNKEVPVELLELWVDSSLDDLSSPHPIRKAYMKYIRKPAEVAGLTIRIVPNLDSELFEKMAPPKFKSIKGQGEWLSTTIEEQMEIERRKLDIPTKDPHIKEPKLATAVEDFPF